jgi:biotin carboxylase
LEEEAALRTDFNIPGITLAEIKQLQRKSYMKGIFQKAGVKAPSGILYENADQVRAFASEVGLPLIAKPDKGVGAQMTYKIHDQKELEDFIINHSGEDYFLEAFVKGQLESFDGLTDQNGKVVFYTSHVFSQGIMETVSKNLDLMYYSRRDIPIDIVEAGLRIHEILKLRNRFFHFEFFRTTENDLMALEINLRPPGGLTVDMFNFANDFDIYYQWANVAIFNQFNARYNRPYHVCYVGRKKQNHYSLSHEEVLGLMGNHLVHHEPINSIFRNAIGDYGYILRDTELGKVTHLANLILQKV